ncbi:protein TIC 20-II, chloroplastic-like [Apium graveolens]|uniref:protein TIC 20-II, chloroplastic-like n=1 Tax=Apium graveolens TaxID=4045 RepID=UPI003D798D7A
MFTLEQTDYKLITAPLSLSLFLASQATSFSQLRFPHRPISTRKTYLGPPLRSTVCFSSPSSFPHTPLKLTRTNNLKISACAHNSTPVTDRLLSAAIYTLPLLDGLGYGAYHIPPGQYPAIYHLYNSTPFTRYVPFLIIQLFVIRNPKLHKYVRHNALQASFLGVLLQVPFFLLKAFGIWPLGMRIGCDLMFLLVVCGFVYITVNTILGKMPQIPLVTDAVATYL